MNNYLVKKGKGSLYLGIFGNLGLFILKLAFGIFAGSIALINDAFHSLSDFLSSSLALMGFRVSLAPADSSHPYGHHKAEPLAGLGVAIFLAGAASFLAYNAFSHISPQTPPKSVALTISLISIISKEIMARYCFRIGNLLKSPSIKATAYDHRSDALSSVAAFLGILGARAGFKFLDPLVGFIISIMILYFSFKIGKKNIDMLMDKVPSRYLVKKITERATEVKGVLDIHNVRVRQLDEEVGLDMHVEVAPGISLIEAHKIAHRVQEKLEEMEEVSTALIHICPQGVKIGEED